MKPRKFLIYKHINGQNRARVVFDNKEMTAIDGCEKNPYVQDYDIVEADSSEEALEKAEYLLQESMQVSPETND